MNALAVSLLALVAVQSETPVADAAQRGDTDAVRELLQSGGDVNAAHGDGMTALHWAAQRGDVELAQMLLYAGANVQATTRNGAYDPLLIASKYGHASMIVTLMKGGADANRRTENGTPALHLAAASGRPMRSRTPAAAKCAS